MSNQAEEKGYNISGPVPIGPVSKEPPFKGLAHKANHHQDSACIGPAPQKLGTALSWPSLDLESSKPAQPIPARPIKVQPIKVLPDPTSPALANSSTTTLSPDAPAHILSLGSQLIAAARREAGQIVADAVEKAEAIEKRTEQSSLARTLAIEADSMLRLANMRDLFIQASATELLELIETAVVAVVGELSAPSISLKASTSVDARSDRSTAFLCARLLRSRIRRAVKEHLPESPARIFIHPDDYEKLIQDDCNSMPGGAGSPTVENAPGYSRLEQNQFFACDPSLPPGDARIHTDFGTVEISIRRQLQMVLRYISSSTALRDSLIAFLEAEDA